MYINDINLNLCVCVDAFVLNIRIWTVVIIYFINDVGLFLCLFYVLN